MVYSLRVRGITFCIRTEKRILFARCRSKGRSLGAERDGRFWEGCATSGYSIASVDISTVIRGVQITNDPNGHPNRIRARGPRGHTLKDKANTPRPYVLLVMTKPGATRP